MKKKYKTEPEGGMLRIIALKDFSDVRKGDKGGLIEKESNLSQYGDCWIYGGAIVRGDARVWGFAQVSGDAIISDNARVSESAKVGGNAKISGNTWVGGNACVSGNVKLWSHLFLFSISITTASIKNNKDYVILGSNKEEFCIYSSYVNPTKTVLPISGQNYIKNIKTIRQIYGEEV